MPDIGEGVVGEQNRYENRLCLRNDVANVFDDNPQLLDGQYLKQSQTVRKEMRLNDQRLEADQFIHINKRRRRAAYQIYDVKYLS